MELVIFGALVLFGIMVAVQVSADRTKREDRQKRLAERRETLVRQKELLSKFIKAETAEWLHVTPAKVNGRNAVIGLSEGGEINLKTYVEMNGLYIVKAHKSLSSQHIISFDVEAPDRTKLVTHKEKVPVATKKKRSSVGRAIVGGVALGPLGAVVGAASGLNGKEQVTYHEVKRQETVKVKGDPLLVLGVRELDEPKLVICFEPAKLAEEWWYRIQSLRA